MIGWVAAATTGVGTILTLRLESSPSAAARTAKMVAASGFVVVALVSGALDSGFGTAVLIGLALSWLGDLFLTYQGTRPFLAGLAAFLLGHIAFVIAFAIRGFDARAAALAGLGAAVLLLRIVPWLMPHVSGQLRVPVLAYTVVISAMIITALATNGAEPDWRIPMGAGAFYLSDIAVARDRFVSPGRINRVWGLPLYFAAQLLLAWAAGG